LVIARVNSSTVVGARCAMLFPSTSAFLPRAQNGDNVFLSLNESVHGRLKPPDSRGKLRQHVDRDEDRKPHVTENTDPKPRPSIHV